MELSGGEEISPTFGVVGAKDSKVGFDLLVGVFGLSVSLGMIGGGEANVVMEEPGKFSGKGGGELRSSIRDQGVMETETFEYVVEKE